MAFGLIPALALGGVWAWSDRELASAEQLAAPAAGQPITSPATPLFSVRRAPSDLVNELTAARLSSVLRPLAATVAQESRQTSCLAVSVDGEQIIDVGAKRTVIPASNLKVLTAAVALEVLGPDYTFTTAAAGALNGNTVEGDLHLIGGGDPMLATNGYETAIKYQKLPATQLADLATALFDAGVRRITGGIVADESRYDTQRFGVGWTDEVTGNGANTIPEAGPLSALMVNDSFELIDDGRRPVGDSAQFAAEQFAAILRFSGIEVAGGVSVGGPTTDGQLAAISSAPLSEIVGEMLRNSDDNAAELLLKEIGLIARSNGNSLDGAQAVLDQLTAWGISTEGITIVDGSGLSSQNKLTCATLIGVLNQVGTAGPLFDGLAIAGESGTLGPLDDNPSGPDNGDQFAGTAADGVMRAKSGTLGQFGAKGLSGYMPIDGSSPIVFSLIGNVDAANQESTETIVLPWWRTLSEAFSAYEPGPTSDQLAPR